MKKTKIRIPAKLNFTLDVTGVKNGYHTISSLVASIDVYDEITVTPRKDDLITLAERGITSGCSVVDNTAYKAAKLFSEMFSTGGADVCVNKNIPVGGGLGGSSADIAGVLKCMQKLYGERHDVLPLANYLGSDSAYMLGGGFAVISDRGNVVTPVKAQTKAYLLLITESKMITARECYKVYDEIADGKTLPCSAVAAERLASGNLEGMCSVAKNDLAVAAMKILPEIADAVSVLKKSGSILANITGSGSTVFGVYGDEALRNAAYLKLLPEFGDRLIRAETL